MASIPRERSIDSTLALLRDPYGFIGKRCRALGCDVFETRILLSRTVCMMGSDAAALFYDEDRFARHGAAPLRLQLTLFGKGGVQAKDGPEHRARKAMFMSLMTPGSIDALVGIADRWWETYAGRWSGRERIVLYDEAREILFRSVCEWAGVPIPEDDVARRTREVTALFDHAGDVGPAHWWARLARARAERWLAGWIDDVRAGHFRVPDDSAAQVIATHRNASGALLPPRVAAVELLNVIRPTVAVAVYIAFAATALHRHPALRAGLGDARSLDAFVQEVRRYYPFFPAVVARVRKTFEWRGLRFERGARAMLDLYGTNHDPRIWTDPASFWPERFLRRQHGPYDFIPQGGGHHMEGHRCPGEWITVALMKAAVRVLTTRIRYEVPDQDLETDFGRLPALPASRFVMTSVTIPAARMLEPVPVSPVSAGA